MRTRYYAKARPRQGSTVGAWRSIGTFASYDEADAATRHFEQRGFDVFIGEEYKNKPSKRELKFSLDAQKPLD